MAWPVSCVSGFRKLVIKLFKEVGEDETCMNERQATNWESGLNEASQGDLRASNPLKAGCDSSALTWSALMPAFREVIGRVKTSGTNVHQSEN